jgi:hypothetical protein
MVSIYKGLYRGESVRAMVLKQIIGGVALLVVAMLSEGLIGYHGTFGEIFLNLNNINNDYLYHFLWRWNYFETVHTIAWCIIINGMVQGLLSLKGHWKDTKSMIISYALLAVLILSLTQPIWDLISYLIPGYPFSSYPNGHNIAMPWIGSESFWHIFRAPFLTALASPWEPIFPYLAVSFIGSIIGIVISQPKEKISKNFPRTMFLVGLGMFLAGLVGTAFILIQIASGTYGMDGFDVMINFYRLISNHRAWAPDAYAIIAGGETVNIPPFSWLAQFCVLNGFSIMIVMFLFRFIEFRGKSNAYANNTKIIRRFGTVAFSNYNNQWIYFFVFFLTSLMIYQVPYQRLFWGGTFLTLFLSLAVFILLLWAWEKIKYIGSLEWFIRTFTNNVVPARRRFCLDKKWWQRGLIDPDRVFYNVDWIDFNDTEKNLEEESENIPIAGKESKFALILSLVGLFSFLFIILSFVGLWISIAARKTEGKNKTNTAALVLSIIGSVLFVGLLITSLILPIGALGLF